MHTTRPLALVAAALALGLLLPSTLVATGWNDGVAAFQAGNWTQAETAFAAQTESTPQHAASWFMLAQTQHRQQKLDAASESFRRAVELAPEEASYSLGWGRTELERGRTDRAVTILTRHSPATVPDKIQETYGQLLAAAVIRSESPEHALDALERAVVEASDQPLLWTALGRARDAAGQADDAWQAYRQAAEISGAVDDRRRLVDFALRNEWFDRAAAEADAVASASGTAEDALRLGEVHLKAGKCEQALPAFERAGELAPRDPYPAYYRGHCRLVLKQGAPALSALDGALSLDPAPELEQKIQTARGQALHLLERYEEAAEAFRRAGDDARATQMDEFAQTAQDNEAWERAKKECRDRLQATRKLLSDSADLEGTPEYRRLEAELDGLRQECSAYL